MIVDTTLTKAERQITKQKERKLDVWLCICKAFAAFEDAEEALLAAGENDNDS